MVVVMSILVLVVVRDVETLVLVVVAITVVVWVLVDGVTKQREALLMSEGGNLFTTAHVSCCSQRPNVQYLRNAGGPPGA